MGELVLGRGGVAQDLQWHREPLHGDHPPDLGPLAGQRAGLVEQHRVDLVHQIERPAVLDEDTLLGAERQRR